MGFNAKRGQAEPNPNAAPLPSEVDEILGQLARMRERLKGLDLAVSSHIAEHPEYGRLIEARDALAKELTQNVERAKLRLKGLKIAQTVGNDAVTFKFSQPMSRTINGKLLIETMPELERIPGLVKRVIEVDPEIFDDAVQAGHIPIALVRMVDKKVPTAEGGRISVVWS